MDHDDTYALMMDALDGELATDGKLELEAHLRACPECHEEWRALLAVDQLFRQTPAISPAAGFTQRTLARLPNRKYRVWALGTIYALLLLAGAMPMMIGGWAITRLGPVVNQPVLVRSLLRSIEQMAQV
ncbi:MAG: anti-sigma factor family protein, partial [Anaerolineae bacterium]